MNKKFPFLDRYIAGPFTLLNSIGMVEFMSTRSKYNVKGMSARLRKNPQFTSLCKQLYLKFKVFSKIPLEMQMFLIVSTKFNGYTNGQRCLLWVLERGYSKILSVIVSFNWLLRYYIT